MRSVDHNPLNKRCDGHHNKKELPVKFFEVAVILRSSSVSLLKRHSFWMHIGTLNGSLFVGMGAWLLADKTGFLHELTHFIPTYFDTFSPHNLSNRAAARRASTLPKY